MGDSIDMSVAQTMCDPAYTNAQMGKTTSLSGKKLNPSDIAYPCGLIARSVFTDTYTLTPSSSTTPLSISPDNIAWTTDVEYKFKNQAGNWRDTQW